MGRGKRPFLPAIWLLDYFSFLVVNMHRNPCVAHFCAHPKPIFVSFEQLLAHGFFFPRRKIPTPIVFAHLKPFPDIRLGRLEREGLGIVNRRDRSRAENERDDR